jgi:signal transduction histidine kinase
MRPMGTTPTDHTLTRRPGTTGTDSGRTLLIVDDEEGPREALRLIFEDHYHVLVARNGFEAVQTVERDRVDAAILDLRMAGMSGIEVLQRIKSRCPDVEVMLLTAYAALESAQDALRLGASDYLTKPCDLATLRAAVARLMERRIEIEQRTATLEQAKTLQRELEDLQHREERLTAQGEIYSGVLHDINKPLTVIVGLTALLSRQLDETPRLEGEAMDVFRGRLQAVARQADNVTEVVHRYLSLLRKSRVESNHASGNRLLLDLRDLLMAYPGMAGRGVRFSFLAEDAELRAHATDVIQMLLNLALNALQACTAQQPVTVGLQHFPNLAAVLAQESISPAHVLAPQGFNPLSPVLAFRVSDAGPGLPPEVLERLTEAPPAPRSSVRGRGLGLSFVRRLIRLNNGAIAVRTAPDQGTTIVLVLPLWTPEPPVSGIPPA